MTATFIKTFDTELANEISEEIRNLESLMIDNKSYLDHGYIQIDEATKLGWDGSRLFCETEGLNKPLIEHKFEIRKKCFNHLHEIRKILVLAQNAFENIGNK